MLTKELLKRLIESHGVEYVIMDYINPETIEDEKLRDLCCKLEKLIREVYNLLGID